MDLDSAIGIIWNQKLNFAKYQSKQNQSEPCNFYFGES